MLSDWVDCRTQSGPEIRGGLGCVKLPQKSTSSPGVFCVHGARYGETNIFVSGSLFQGFRFAVPRAENTEDPGDEVAQKFHFEVRSAEFYFSRLTKKYKLLTVQVRPSVGLHNLAPLEKFREDDPELNSWRKTDVGRLFSAEICSHFFDYCEMFVGCSNNTYRHEFMIV